MQTNEIIIFGAGELGKRVLERDKEHRVICFVDNNTLLQGQKYKGKDIIGLGEYIERYSDVKILICAKWKNACEIIKQLGANGISNWMVYTPQLFEDNDLLINQYEENDSVDTEADWNKKLESSVNREKIKCLVDELSKETPIFHEIEIETVNRCNGKCTFCPVNANADIRTLEFMDEKLFKKIILELEEIQYSGRIALFSNNEPFIDKRIVDFHRFAREHLQKAQFHLFTNGTLLTIDKFKEIIEYLDELIIDNYDQNLNLHSNVAAIKEYIENCNDIMLRKKVKILLRKPNEILSSRGGDSPNRKFTIDVSSDTCALPFQQMIVRPSGKVSLCCNDPYGRITMGDLKYEHILDVWYGDAYQKLRSILIFSGRKGIKHCNQCDTFMYI